MSECEQLLVEERNAGHLDKNIKLKTFILCQLLESSLFVVTKKKKKRSYKSISHGEAQTRDRGTMAHQRYSGKILKS